jgi:phage tail sheath gpL-like
MTISFNQIPTSLLIPFTAIEFDSSKAQQGPALLSYKAIIIGQKLAAGSAVADTIQRVSSLDQVIALAGRGSMLHQQYLYWTAINKSTELWMGFLADNGAGVAAQGSIVVAGPATAAGTIALYLGGVLVTVGVNSGDASTVIATAIGAAINAAADLPVTASVGASTVTITYRHKGLVGNTYDVRHSFNFGEALPAGVTLTITAVGTAVAGTTNPTLTNLIAAMTDVWFQIWTHPYTDATSLTAIETELATRFGPMRQQGGVAITSPPVRSRRSRLSARRATRRTPRSSRSPAQRRWSRRRSSPRRRRRPRVLRGRSTRGGRSRRSRTRVRSRPPSPTLFDATERNLLWRPASRRRSVSPAASCSSSAW